MKKLVFSLLPILLFCEIASSQRIYISPYLRLNAKILQYDSAHSILSPNFRDIATIGYVQGWVATHASVITLTTTGTSGPSTFNAGTGVLNVPNYTPGSGLTSLNALTGTVQTFATGTAGSDFGISSVGTTHTFNIPTASGSNRGLLSTADWTTFNAKQGAITLTTTGSSGAATLIGTTLNIPQYTGSSVGVMVGGSLVGTRPTINLIPGTSTSIGGADDVGNNRVNVTISVTGLSGALVVSLTDGVTIPVDATLGYAIGATYKVTIAGNRTMSNPTGAVDGQKFLFRIKQDATGSRVITWDTKYRFSTDLPTPVLSTSAGYIDYIGFIYNAADDKFDIISVNLGVH